MFENVIKTLKPQALNDPGFYAAKQGLRAAFPEASMIELAEGALTVVIAGRAHKAFL